MEEETKVVQKGYLEHGKTENLVVGVPLKHSIMFSALRVREDQEI